MRETFRATALLGRTSALTLLISLSSNKIRAVVLGPDGVATAALLSTTIALGAIPAALGTGPALVRHLARAIAEEDELVIAALRRGAWIIRATSTLLIVAVIIWFREPLSIDIFGRNTEAVALLVAAATLALNLVADLQTSILNGYQRLRALALQGLLAAALGTAASSTIIVLAGSRGIAPAMLTASAVGLTVSTVLLRRNLTAVRSHPSGRQLRAAMASLLRFGAPFTLSLAVGTGVLAALPLLVLHQLGSTAVAYYQAAFLVGGTYLGFLTSAMALDYYPRLSVASATHRLLNSMVNEQFQLVTVITVPMILLTATAAPLLMPAIYTRAFDPSTPVLEWLLCGDIFRFASWTLSFAILARWGGALFFATEAVSGAVTLGSSWLAMKAFGVQGVGIAYLLTYAIYFALVLVILARGTGFRLSPRNLFGFAVAVSLTGTFQVATVLGGPALHWSVGAVCTGVAVAHSRRTLRHAFGPRWVRQLRARSTPETVGGDSHFGG